MKSYAVILDKILQPVSIICREHTMLLDRLLVLRLHEGVINHVPTPSNDKKWKKKKKPENQKRKYDPSTQHDDVVVPLPACLSLMVSALPILELCSIFYSFF